MEGSLSKLPCVSHQRAHDLAEKSCATSAVAALAFDTKEHQGLSEDKSKQQAGKHYNYLECSRMVGL